MNIEDQQNFQNEIEDIWQKDLKNLTPKQKQLIEQIVEYIDLGKLKVATYHKKLWQVNEWIKKAILLYLYSSKMIFDNNMANIFYDKIPSKFQHWNQEMLEQAKLRISFNAVVRKGVFLASGVILMPNIFINIGAYIGSNTMIDSNACIGSCAQIGANCHISSGVVIGGVIEPISANPVIIEDNVFIGANCSITEGIIIKSGVVIASGVNITSSVKIYDTINKKFYERLIPENAVVILGMIQKDETHFSYACALIIKYIDDKTRGKVAINQLLRESIDEHNKIIKI